MITAIDSVRHGNISIKDYVRWAYESRKQDEKGMIYVPANTLVQGSSSGSPVGVVTPAAVGVAWLQWSNGTTWISNGLTNTSWVSTSGGGAVSSVFTRTGAVVANKGDYNATQVPNVVVSVTQSATPTLNSGNGTIFECFNLAQAVTSLTDSGTPIDGQEMTTVFSDNGTARALALGTQFTGSGAALPSSTAPGQYLYIKWIYSSALTAWVYQSSNTTTITNVSGVLGAPVALTVANTVYTVLTTPSLATGIWLLTVTASMHDSGGSGGVCEVELVVGSATATFSGPVVAGNSPYYNQATVSFTCVVTVTVTGTLTIQGKSSNTGQLVANVSETFGTNATGYTAVKIG